MMRFEKSCNLTKWTEWNSTFAKTIDDFYVSYSVYPNILEANRYTYSQIDFLFNVIPGEKQKLHRIDELTNKIIQPQEIEEVSIFSYKSDFCSVEFAIDENLSDKDFLLIFDSDPDWGDDSINKIPVENEKLVFNIL
jgi:hypothetical protein